MEQALYILSKNVLGQNITNKIYPVVKQVAVGFTQVGEGLETIGGVLPSPLAAIRDTITKVTATSAEEEKEEFSPYYEDYYDGGYVAQPSNGNENQLTNFCIAFKAFLFPFLIFIACN